MADDKGCAVHVNIRRSPVAEREVIEIGGAGGDFDAGRAGRVGVELEARIGDAGLRRTRTAVDGKVAPVAARPEAGEENRRLRRAVSEQATTIGDRHVLAGLKANDHTRLDGQAHARIYRKGISHHIMYP